MYGTPNTIEGLLEDGTLLNIQPYSTFIKREEEHGFPTN